LQDKYRKVRHLLFHDISARNTAETGRPKKSILRPNISLGKKEKKDAFKVYKNNNKNTKARDN